LPRVAYLHSVTEQPQLVAVTVPASQGMRGPGTQTSLQLSVVFSTFHPHIVRLMD